MEIEKRIEILKGKLIGRSYQVAVKTLGMASDSKDNQDGTTEYRFGEILIELDEKSNLILAVY